MPLTALTRVHDAETTKAAESPLTKGINVPVTFTTWPLKGGIPFGVTPEIVAVERKRVRNGITKHTHTHRQNQ